MSFLFGWFWSDKKVEQFEAEQASNVQHLLMKELHNVFSASDLKKWAERKYDYEKVYEELVSILDSIDKCYHKARLHNGKWFFASDEIRDQCRNLCEKYFDAVIRNKEFVEDNEVLRLAVARKLLEYAALEGFRFDWHYWQLYRRIIEDDLLDQDTALSAIERTKPCRLRGLIKVDNDNYSDDDDEASWDDSSE